MVKKGPIPSKTNPLYLPLIAVFKRVAKGSVVVIVVIAFVTV